MVRGATISGSWVRSVTRRCDRRSASGFVGDLVRTGSRTMARRSHWWCDVLSTLSISFFARGPKMARRSRWSVTGFDEDGFEWSERCDLLALMRSSCFDVGDLLALSLSLSLLFSKAGNHLKWKWKRKSFSVVLALIFGQLEMLFSLTYTQFSRKSFPESVWSQNKQSLSFPWSEACVLHMTGMRRVNIGWRQLCLASISRVRPSCETARHLWDILFCQSVLSDTHFLYPHYIYPYYPQMMRKASERKP